MNIKPERIFSKSLEEFDKLMKDFDEMLVMLHGTGLPGYESVTKFCEIYSAILNCRMRLTTKLLMKINVVGKNNDDRFKNKKPLNEYEISWGELVGINYRFYKICEEVFPENPADSMECYDLHNELKAYIKKSDIFARLEKEDCNDCTIVIEDSPLPGGLTDIYVLDEDGNIKGLHEYDTKLLTQMSIMILSKEVMDYDTIMVLLCMYILYPLRMMRRRKRDEISRLLGVLKNVNNAV